MITLYPPIVTDAERPCCLHPDDHDEFTCDLFTALSRPLCADDPSQP